jgi:hypothetical protein
VISFYPTASFGQKKADPDDSYVPIPLSLQGDRAAREFLDQKLGRTRSMNDLEKLVREVAKDYKGNDLSEEQRQSLKKMAENIDWNDPKTQELMRRLVENPPEELKGDLEKKFTEDQRKEMAKLIESMKSAPAAPGGDPGKDPADPQQPSPDKGSASSPDQPDRDSRAPKPNDTSGPLAPPPEGSLHLGNSTAKIARELLSKTGLLSHPSSLRKTLSALAHPTARKGDPANAGAPGGGRLSGITKLFASDRGNSGDGNSGSTSLLSRIGIPGMSGSSGGNSIDTETGRGPDGGSMGGFLVIVVTLGLLAGAAYLLLRSWRENSTASRAPAWKLGPWPVHPAAVGTRQQLVQAFEYLAVLLLGRQARNRNHREIAGGLGATNAGDRAARSRAAHLLAGLYEQARYSPPNEPLHPEQLAEARRELALLAGLGNT